MRTRLQLLLLILSFIVLPAMAADVEWTPFRVDERVNFSIPSDWKWQEIKMNYDWMNAYLVTTPKVPGLYTLVMVFDNPTYQVPDQDVLDELVYSLMKDYPEYTQSGETKYGTDEKRPQFSFSEYDNTHSEEKLTLILAGNKKTLVYLWLVYPSEDAIALYKPVMNEIASSLTIL